MIYSNSFFKKTNFQNKKKNVYKNMIIYARRRRNMKFAMKLPLEISALWL